MKIQDLKDLKIRNLNGNSLKADSPTEVNFDLTEDEVYLIQEVIKNKSYYKSTLVPISKRLHLDFIGWNNPRYMDALICKTHKKGGFGSHKGGVRHYSDFEQGFAKVNIGYIVKNMRDELGLTQQEFANKIGVKQSYVSQVESNKFDIGLNKIQDWCSKLGVQFNRFAVPTKH